MPVKSFNTKYYPIVGLILLLGVGFYTGALAGFVSGLPSAAFGSPTATITPVQTVPSVISPGTLTTCQQAVSPDILGLSATIFANAYDREANQPFAAAVDTTWWLVQNGQIQAYTDSTAASATGFSVGDVVSVYGGGTTYYATPQPTICLDTQSYALDIDVHTIATIQNLQITGYDSTSAATLSAGTNASQENYDIVLGADQVDVFYLKLQVNTSNVAFQLTGIATVASNDIKDVEPINDQGLTKVTLPDFLNILITGDHGVGVGTNFSTGYDDLWLLDQPIMLHEWDEVKYKFTIEASSTDPATNNDPAAGDNALVCFLDGAWSRAGDGAIKYGIYQLDDSEANVGLTEEVSLPMTSGTCVNVEGI